MLHAANVRRFRRFDANTTSPIRQRADVNQRIVWNDLELKLLANRHEIEWRTIYRLHAGVDSRITDLGHGEDVAAINHE